VERTTCTTFQICRTVLNYLDRRVTSLELRQFTVAFGRWPFRISAATHINTTNSIMGFNRLSIQIRSQYLTWNKGSFLPGTFQFVLHQLIHLVIPCSLIGIVQRDSATDLNIRTSRLWVTVESVGLSGSKRSSQQEKCLNLFVYVAAPSIALTTQHEITGLRVNCMGRGRKQRWPYLRYALVRTEENIEKPDRWAQFSIRE
jgi:hypothetical protein